MEYSANDGRLARRLKRKSICNRNFKHNNSANVRQRTVNNDSQKEYAVTRDDDYQMHIDNLIKYDDPVDIGVPIVVDEPSFCEITDDTYLNDEWDDHVKVDPDYMMFWKGLREVGKSYVLEVSTGDGALVVEYEGEVLFDRHPVSLVKSNNIRKRINAEHTRNSWSSSSERAEKADKSYMKFLDFFETSLKERDNLVYTPCSTKLASDYDAGSCERAEKAVKSSSSERAEETDEPYMKLLNYFETSLKERDNLVACDTKYASDYDAGSCDSEVIMLDFDPSASESHSPFMTSKSVVVAVDVDSGSCLQSHRASPSAQFRAGLLKDLKKPYNQAEYESLLEEVTCRKETLGHRIFRSGIKSYKRDSIGKSYLDIYGDLAAKINQVRRNRRRVLNILRGFFYWLKNLAHEGAFLPWLDPCCMETLPVSKQKMAPHQISSFSS